MRFRVYPVLLLLILLMEPFSARAALIVIPTPAGRACATLGDRSKLAATKESALALAKQRFHGELDGSLRKYRTYEAALYSVASELSGIELSPRKLEQRTHELGEALAREIEATPSIPAAERHAMSASVRRLRVITFDWISRQPRKKEREWASNAMKELCGRELTEATAYAATSIGSGKDRVGPSAPSLLVCPALAIHLVPVKAQALDFVLAHELGHFASRAGQSTADEKLRQCWKDHYGSQFRSLPDVVELLSPIYRSQVTEGAKAIFFSREGSLIRQARTLQVDMTERLGHPPESIDTHVFEAVGDYWATRVIASRVASTPGQSPEQAVAEGVSLFCDELSLNKREPLDGDEGIHPSFQFRIENYLRHPAFREKLGTLAPLGPWCDL